MIQPRLPHGGDDDPVAGQIDGVAIGLVHGGHAPPRKRAVQRIAGALAFEDGDELLLVLLEAAQDGIGDLAVHLDVAFAGKGEGVRRSGRAGVAEQAAEDVGEEVREQGGFLEIVRAAGGDEAGPVLEFGLPVRHALRQVEGPHLLAEDFRVEERFGFERHLFSGRLCRDGKKPSVLARLGCSAGLSQAHRESSHQQKPKQTPLTQISLQSSPDRAPPKSLMRTPSQPLASRQAPPSHPRATPKPPQSIPRACSELGASLGRAWDQHGTSLLRATAGGR